jgi:hypothetical protein
MQSLVRTPTLVTMVPSTMFLPKDISAQVFFSYLKPRLQKFITYNFVAHFQEEQYKTCLENFMLESCMSIIEFVENYTFQDFNEIQEMHWHCLDFITILV